MTGVYIYWMSTLVHIGCFRPHKTCIMFKDDTNILTAIERHLNNKKNTTTGQKLLWTTSLNNFYKFSTNNTALNHAQLNTSTMFLGACYLKTIWTGASIEALENYLNNLRTKKNSNNHQQSYQQNYLYQKLYKSLLLRAIWIPPTIWNHSIGGRKPSAQ